MCHESNTTSDKTTPITHSPKQRRRSTGDMSKLDIIVDEDKMEMKSTGSEDLISEDMGSLSSTEVLDWNDTKYNSLVSPDKEEEDTGTGTILRNIPYEAEAGNRLSQLQLAKSEENRPESIVEIAYNL